MKIYLSSLIVVFSECVFMYCICIRTTLIAFVMVFMFCLLVALV